MRRFFETLSSLTAATRGGRPPPKLHDAPTVRPRASAWEFRPAVVVMNEPNTSSDLVTLTCRPPPKSSISRRARPIVVGTQVGRHRSPAGVGRVDAAMRLLPSADREDPDGRRDHIADLDVEVAAIVVDPLDPFREAVPVPGLHEGPRERRTERPRRYTDPTSSSRTRVP